VVWCHDLGQLLRDDEAPELADASPSLLDECIQGRSADVLACSAPANVNQGLGACMEACGATQRGWTERALTSQGLPGQGAEVGPATHTGFVIV
jgi:hypothetical protein